MDAIDEQSASGKLDLIIQLPYVIKSEARRQQAEQRRKDIEFQLKGSQYGIAYTDGTEKITQLNRPAENNLMAQVEYLTEMLYGQLGLTEEVMNGTADEKAMLNYWNRTIEPVLTAMVEAMRRTFLTKTARTQKQAILFFRDPFRLVPIENIAEIADKFTRNEIMSSNEIRQVIGLAPHKDPKADKLVNSNMPAANPAREQNPNGAIIQSEKTPKLELAPSSDTRLREGRSKWEQRLSLTLAAMPRKLDLSARTAGQLCRCFQASGQGNRSTGLAARSQRAQPMFSDMQFLRIVRMAFMPTVSSTIPITARTPNAGSSTRTSSLCPSMLTS